MPATKQAAAFINDFEFAADAPGVRTTDNQAMFDVTRVASGTDGIKASSGGWYAQAAHNDWVTGTLQPFTRYGGYSHTFGDGYTTSVDIYLDMTKAVGGNRHFNWVGTLQQRARVRRVRSRLHLQCRREVVGSRLVHRERRQRRPGCPGERR